MDRLDSPTLGLAIQFLLHGTPQSLSCQRERITALGTSSKLNASNTGSEIGSWTGGMARLFFLVGRSNP